MVTPNTFPAPIGVTLSFSNLQAGNTTAPFTLEAGAYTVALEAVDPNNPGIVTVDDANSTAVVIMLSPGYAFMFVGPAGATFTVNVTAAVNRVSFTKERK